MGNPSGGRSFEFRERGNRVNCASTTFDIGVNLAGVLLALIGALGGLFAAYKANANHIILKNGGPPHV